MNNPILSLMRPKEIVLSNGKKVYKKRSYTLFVVLLIALLIYLSAKMTGFNLQVLIKRGEQFFVILKRMVPPNTAYIDEVIPPLLDTIKMSVLGTFIGALLAIPYAMWSATNLTKNNWITSLLKLLLSLIRTLPTLVIALILTYVFGLGTFAGTLSIAIFTFSFVAKQLYEAIETADMLPYEAMEALGANKMYSFLGAIKPQVLPTYLSVALYTFEGNVRHAAILGYVGAGGIGIILDENLGWREYQNVGMILLCLFLTVVVIESVSRYLRARLT
ncbi:phosphonate ABC transporter, permease protein PhnE [Facklamia sp. 7083-14-GEN3]|uniref:phosphonate ABC transporter, permease protein PhnE n=1 Tax=Facklamia sp. 7083-14-GEN3 TaxID=2973478 RepID=UPI00215CB043|nr:phosphonate ABC transporter, permease protein PhnE [Facklamia sp. 7083-14-GEN3]MCR8969790.1 phosphonate ABC transporter, permease protein PhnE [Facklamia sp. 7083-14-GEN3]